jgi:hypothetical protein
MSGTVTKLVSRQALQALIPSATMTPIRVFTQMPVMLKNGLFYIESGGDAIGPVLVAFASGGQRNDQHSILL